MQYKQTFLDAMDKLGKMHENSKVYVDFMDYYIYQNSKSPDRTLPTGYKPEEMEMFQEAYISFGAMMEELIEKHGWYDFIGEYYEEFVLGSTKSQKKGQFYTPRAISDLISKLVGNPVELADAYDPACGSARNLLDYHSRNPGVRCTGEDLDESSCKMAVINFHLHGVNGVVNWIDALTREYMGVSWRVMNGKIIITDLDWIRAVDDVCDAISILLLSDETLSRVLQKVSETMPIDTSNNNSKNVLDSWITTKQ